MLEFGDRQAVAIRKYSNLKSGLSKAIIEDYTQRRES